MITMANRNTWNGVAGNKLQFIVNYRTGLNCASGAYNVSTGNLSRFSNASVLFYSRCTVALNNLNGFTGQDTLNYQPVLVDGLDNVQGFNQNVVYIREVVS